MFSFAGYAGVGRGFEVEGLSVLPGAERRDLGVAFVRSYRNMNRPFFSLLQCARKQHFAALCSRNGRMPRGNVVLILLAHKQGQANVFFHRFRFSEESPNVEWQHGWGHRRVTIPIFSLCTAVAPKGKSQISSGVDYFVVRGSIDRPRLERPERIRFVLCCCILCVCMI